jgi:glycosyltransferase involved in cell wall biosynthesis
MNSSPGISVVIRTKNSGKTLSDVIRRLNVGELDEVIVVDSGSQDSTLEIVKEHKAKLVLAHGPFSYGRSLNLGFNAAKNPWILVLSSHCIPVSFHYLNDLRDAISEFPEKLAVAYGLCRLTVDTCATSPQPVHYLYWSDWEKQKVWSRGNGNALYRSDYWHQHQFDESLVTAEDLEWFLWALRSGLAAARLDDAVVLYRNQGSLRHMFGKGFNESKIACTMGQVPAMPLSGFWVGIASLTKKLVLLQISFSTFLRQCAQHYGAFLGSRKTG